MSVRRRAWLPTLATMVLALLTVLTVLSGCTLGPSSRPDVAVYGERPQPASNSQGTIPLGPGGPGQEAELDPSWQDCADQADPPAGAGVFALSCAELPVPLNYADSSAGSISLDVARARAGGLPEDAPALVVVLANGALEATTASVDRLGTIAAALPTEITARFQIIGLDVRGTGGSSRADCWHDYPQEYLYSLNADLTAPDSGTQLSEVTRAFTFGCQDYVGPEMVLFSTTQAADDLDSLRSALGSTTLNFLGSGYGATLGAVYAHRYPGRVGSFVLDSPTDHAAEPADRAVISATQFERTLQAFFADCAAGADCPLGPDPAATVTAALGNLRFDPDTLSDDADYGSSAVLWAMLMALPDQADWPGLATAISDAADGDQDTLVTLLTDLLAAPRAYLSTRMMFDCNDTEERLADSDLPARFAAAKEAAPTFGSFMVGLASLCRQWPAPEAALGQLRGQGAAPILVVGGVNDPVAPYVGVQAVSSQLASASLISYQGNSHGGYPASPCITAAVDTYLLAGTMPPAGTLCAA